MKQRSTTPPVSRKFLAQSTLVAMSILVASAGVIQLGSNVLARDYNSEIQAKQQEASRLDAESERLRGVAATLAEAVSRLQNQINEIQAILTKVKRSTMI